MASLGQFRKKAGLTQGQLADRVGVSRNTVWRWEAGHFQPTAALVARLAQALGVTGESVLRAVGAVKKGHRWPK